MQPVGGGHQTLMPHALSTLMQLKLMHCGVLAEAQCQIRHLQRCARQTALERQDLSCTYLAHHELESVITTIIRKIVGLTGMHKTGCSVEKTLLLPVPSSQRAGQQCCL